MIKPNNEACKTALFKNGYLRLLMTLVGFRRVGDDDDLTTPWIAPSDLSADKLKQALDLIKAAEFDPPTFDDGNDAEAHIRRKSAAANRKRAAYDDEDDGIDDDEEMLFPMGGPTPRAKSDALAALKKTRRKTRRSDGEEAEELSDEVLRQREKARREKELEKQRKIKSDLFVHDSDDEEDEERDRAFFEEEERRREKIKRGLLVAQPVEKVRAKGKPPKKVGGRRRVAQMESDDEDVAEQETTPSSPNNKRSAESDVEEVDMDTPLSSPHVRSTGSKRARLDTEDLESASDSAVVTKDVRMIDLDDDEEEEEDVPVARRPRKAYGGFVVDSSDEE